MTWLFIVVGILTAALAGALIGGLTSGGVSELTTSHAHEPLPGGELGEADLRGLVFDRALRGYRMDEVDDVIDRLRSELAMKDLRITELESGRRAGVTAGDTGDQPVIEQPPTGDGT